MDLQAMVDASIKRRLGPILANETASALGIQRLYRYKPLSQGAFEELVIQGRLRFSAPAFFNDPWECRARLATDNLNDDELVTRRINFINRAAMKGKYRSNTRLISTIAADLYAARQKLKAMIEATAERYTAKIRQDTRMLCLSLRHDHPLLWAHYAHGHTGVCFEFDTNKNVIFGNAVRVRYVDEYPAVEIDTQDRDELTLSAILTKDKIWAYEDEYRVVWKSGSQKNPFLDNEDYVKIYDHDMLKAIVVGCEMSQKDRVTVAAVVKEAGYPIELKQALRRRDRYAIDIVPW